MKERILITAMLLLILAISQVKGQDSVIKRPYFPQVGIACSVWGCNCFTPIEMPEWVFGGDIELIPYDQVDTIGRDYVYLVRDSAQLINTGKIIVSGDYVNVLLEPIPGKVTRWEIIRREEEPMITVVNNTELTFTGLWEHPAGATYTVSHSNQVGATAKYSFTGNRVEVISDLDPSHGKLGYTINSGTEKFVDLYKATRLNGQVVINEIVPPGFNTITFRVIDNTVLIDYLRISR